jgi:putative peptidoglycan lipid II flippase
MFAPQVPLYGIGAVLAGYLQAGRRFAWPAVAPLLSSVVVIGVYGAFGWLTGGTGPAAGQLGEGARALLGWGTTAGVAALTLPLLAPARRAGLRLRWTYRLGPGVARRALALAGAGIGALLAQQVAVLACVALANRAGGQGALPLWQYAQAVYLLPYAALAVPVATVAFTHLAAAREQAGQEGFVATAAVSTRMALAAGLAGAAALVGAIPGVAEAFAAIDLGRTAGLTQAVTWLAPGLVGYSLINHLSRVLYAAGRPRAVVAATAAGWGLAAIAAAAAVWLLPPGTEPGRALTGLGLGMSVGMTAGGVALAVAARRALGAGALAGLTRSLAIAGAGALAGGWLGHWAGAAIVGGASNAGTGAAAAAAAGSGAPASLWTGILAAAVGALTALACAGGAALADHRAPRRATAP